MTAYETLLDEAYQLGLIVKEVHLKTRKGRCVGNRIAIDKSIKTDEEKACILKEEISHYLTTVGDITHQDILSNKKQENTARAFAIEEKCSIEHIISAIKKGALSQHEIIDILHITDEFFDEAIQYHNRRQGGYYISNDGLILYFDNGFGIYRMGSRADNIRYDFE